MAENSAVKWAGHLVAWLVAHWVVNLAESSAGAMAEKRVECSVVQKADQKVENLVFCLAVHWGERLAEKTAFYLVDYLGENSVGLLVRQSVWL